MVNPLFWEGKKVFLTGNTGFKGAWFSVWLQSMGATVLGYSKDIPTKPSMYKKVNLSKYLTTQFQDISSYSILENSIDKFSPDLVFHFAAQSLVRYSYTNPLETYESNVMGTANLLEACRNKKNIKSIVVITTDKCYENKEWIWGYRENEAMGGYDPYSASKGCAELVVSSYRNSFFSRDNTALIASTRAGNVIGGGDWAEDRLVPDILEAFSRSEQVIIRSPNSIRPWQHVLEPLNGYLMLAEKLFEGQSSYTGGWNFGPNDTDAQTVEWVVNRISELWGDGVSWSIDNNAQNPYEANYLKLDISKAKSCLGWQPKWDLDTALKKIVDWHKSYLSNENMYKKTLSQITEFMRDKK